MAPQPLESREQFIRRLSLVRGVDVARAPLRFGGHHYTHAVVIADGGWQVRRLVLDPAKGQAFLAAHGRFMPEDAELLSEPGPVVLQANSLEELIGALQTSPWPLL